MDSTTVSRKRKSATARPQRGVTPANRSPLSVPLPDELRTRLARQASARGLELAAAARMLLDERLQELEDARSLSQAEEWQRAQAWAAFEAVQEGTVNDVPMEEFRAVTEQALARMSKTAVKR